MKYKYEDNGLKMGPLQYGLDILCGKWNARIICVLSAGTNKRYNEIKKELDNINDAVLSRILKKLFEEDVIKRKQYNEIPLRVEYNLTDKGKSLLPILRLICKWSLNYIEMNKETKFYLCEYCNKLLKDPSNMTE